MAYQINGQPLGLDRPFTDANGTQYPANWLRYATAAEKAAIGITEVADPERYDQRFYWGVGNPKALEDVNEVDDNGDPILDADGNQVVTKGLKSQWIAKQKETAGSLLAPSDWYVTRKYESSVDVPADVTTRRAAIRTTCNTRESEINACTTTDELAALMTNPDRVENSEGEMVANTEPFITRWPE
jgi:hypothetical protein